VSIVLGVSPLQAIGMYPSISEELWNQMEDPPGLRLEILDGQLVMNPAPDDQHNRFGEDLSDIFRAAIARQGLTYDVTTDVEFRSIDAGEVRESPRGDIVIGTVDRERGYHVLVPLLVVEVWDPLTAPYRIAGKRAYWQALGVRHYWQVRLADPLRPGRRQTTLEVFDFERGGDPMTTATGDEHLDVDQPLAVTVVPNEVRGWALRETQRANTETQRADTEAQRADAAERRANAAEERAQALAARLRELGDDAD
jgi:Uma2 family endonuclease